VINASTYSKNLPFDDTDLPLLVILARAVAMTIEIADLQKGVKTPIYKRFIPWQEPLISKTVIPMIIPKMLPNMQHLWDVN